MGVESPAPAAHVDKALAQSASLRPGVLTVIMPIYNERSTILELVERVLAVRVDKEIIIVDDASTDGTREILRDSAAGNSPLVRILYHDTNLGKGAAIRTAIPNATGEFSIVQDGDLEYNPEDYVAILNGFRDPNVSAVYGSRFTGGWPRMRPANKLVNMLLAQMVRVLYKTPMTDEATCYKAFRTGVLQSIPLSCRRFEFCPEVTAKVIRRGHRIVEVPIRYEARTMADGKKIRWTDGVAAIWALLKYRFARF